MEYLPEGAKTWIFQNLPPVEELAPCVSYYLTAEDLQADVDFETVREKLADSIIYEDDLDKWVETLRYNPETDSLPPVVLENVDMIAHAVMDVYIDQILSGVWDDIIMEACENEELTGDFL